ncbi:MAG: hypothetical protein DRP11_05485, partial [Candidatus Aenigmatarchaeota archaeon]
MVQHIRRTQFVITYGPGAILEGQHGARIILSPDIGLFSHGRDPKDFEITDERMSKGLLGGKKIFRLPSNAELGYDDSRAIYKTEIFPEWRICSEHWLLFRCTDGCPECFREKGGLKEKDMCKSWDAIRFVLACSNGHLDDVNWDYAVHMNRGGKCSSGDFPRYYHWETHGSALRDVTIRCPLCDSEVNLGRLYRKEDWRCSGRLPEKNIREPCDRNAIMILRQASNLRIPEIISLFTVPPRYTKLHLLLETPAVRSVLLMLEMDKKVPKEKEELERYLRKLVESRSIKEDVFIQILSHPWEEIEQAIKDILTSEKKEGYKNLLLEEFHAFIDASIHGAPPYRAPPFTSPVVFEVPKNSIEKGIKSSSGRLYRVVPVTRLRTVIVQKGYRRIDPEGRVVDISFRDKGGDDWYPGVELLGEGIFVMLDENDGFHPTVKSDAWDKWMKCHETPPKTYSEFLFDERKYDLLHPVFVWWHTLSHLLLRAVSIDSGYSPASIRERVYIEKTKEGVRGGLILYTVQPGEGTMGGLISLAKRFGKLLERAVE